MRKRIRGTQKKLSFIPPKLNRAVLALARAVSTPYIRMKLGLVIEEVEGIERLIHAYRKFFDGKSRLILVFRHVHVHDAQLIFQLVNSILPKSAKSSGQKLPLRPHVHFLYGRGVPLWGGRWLGLLFSRLGGIPVRHRELERPSIEVIRRCIASGKYPLALAPEGQVTYHNRHVYEIEPGFAQIALWGIEDLRDRGTGEEINILPISQYYRYGDSPLSELHGVLDRIDRETGFSASPPSFLPSSTLPLKEAQLKTSAHVILEVAKMRLEGCGIRVLSMVERFYRDYYHISFEEESCPGNGEFSRRRVERATDRILTLLEERLGIGFPYESFTPRIFTVRQKMWSRIFREDPDSQKKENPISGSLNDYIAEEADLLSRHLEVVDILSYLRPEYGMEGQEANMLVETALNLYDVTLRLRGGDISDRPDIRPTYGRISVGHTISLSKEEYLNRKESVRTLRNRLAERVRRQIEELSRQ